MSQLNTTITVKKETKDELDLLKLCQEESYNSLLKRTILKNKLEETKNAAAN